MTCKLMNRLLVHNCTWMLYVRVYVYQNKTVLAKYFVTSPAPRQVTESWELEPGYFVTIVAA